MGNRLLGMVRVPLIRRRQEQKINSSSTSTVLIKDMEWLPDYGAKEHPLLILTEASILIPGPRCIGLLNMKEWMGHDDVNHAHVSLLPSSSTSSSLSSPSCTCLSLAKRKHENNTMCDEKEDECLQLARIAYHQQPHEEQQRQCLHVETTRNEESLTAHQQPQRAKQKESKL